MVGWFDVLARGAAWAALRSCAAEVRADDNGEAVDAVAAFAAPAAGVLGGGVPWFLAGADVQATRLISAAAPTAHLRKANATPPGCHATPMRILGCAAGVSHLMIETRLACGIPMQPAVAEPSVTCRKKALPLPWRTPPGALRVL